MQQQRCWQKAKSEKNPKRQRCRILSKSHIASSRQKQQQIKKTLSERLGQQNAIQTNNFRPGSKLCQKASAKI